MLRSLAMRSLPKPVALAVSLLLAMSFTPLGALSAWGASGPSVDVYDQCQVGNPPVAGDTCEKWTNGILNGEHNVYNEDDVTPQRLVMSFPTAGTQTVDLTYLTYDHDVHAYDSLATWNHTVTNADRCAGIGSPANCVGGSPNTFPIPLDGTVHHDVGVGKSPIVSNHQLTGQVLTMYGGTLTNAAYLGMNPSTDYQTLQVTFTTTGVNAKVMLLFGGHIAATFGPRGWGERANGDNLGAAQVPGGSYHIQITKINGEAIGQRDNQLMSDAIAPPAETAIVTNATGQVTIGASITDTATITPSNAVGAVNFSVYGPNDGDCSGSTVFTSNNQPVVSGTATSEAFTPTAVGTYRWIASFTPTDPTKFDPISGVCNAANESSVVVKRQPAIGTQASDEATLPDASLSDVATVTNLTSDATGDVTFDLFGPDDETCETSIFNDTQPVDGLVVSNAAEVTSESHTVNLAGTYRWITSYAGDDKNAPVAGACNDPNESTVVNKAPATITTDAQDTAKLPDATITDSATLDGVTSGAGGEIIFKLYGPDDSPETPTCDDGVGGNLVFTSTAGDFPVDGEATYGPASTTVDQAGTYFWVATYTGDDNNLGVSGECGDPTETSDVDKASPTISTSATDGTLPGGSISDTATVKGLTDDATGSVDFSLWDNDSCTGLAIFTDSQDLDSVVNGEAEVTSDSFPVTQAGDFNWVASYTGDKNNDSATGACLAAGETSTVNPATPNISTNASDAQLPAGTIHDVATVSGLTSDALGTVDFALWDNDTCDGLAIFTDSQPLGDASSGTVNVTSDNYTPTTAGDYFWVATYSGDDNNVGTGGDCGDEGETSTVSKAEPTIETVADESATLPDGTLSDTASLSGLTSEATGTVIFRLYGPDETPLVPTCDEASLAFSSELIPIVNNGNGTATAESGDFLPTEAGTYFWVASYSGNTDNEDVSGECGDTGETSTVNPASPTISTSATDAQLPAGTIHDIATVTGLTTDATGDVRFDLYDNDECTGDTVFSDTEPLGSVTDGTASVTSANFPPTAAGSYYWIAFYLGDANNLAVHGDCGDEGETSTVTKADTTITTDAADEAPATQDGSGVVLTDTATLSGATENAGGDITFTLYGPFDTLEDVSCEGEGTTVGEPVSVDDNGSYESDPVTVTEFGFYTWVASYSGDANNESADHACGLPAETVQFQPTLEKTADPASGGVVQPDGSIEYTVTVGNTGDIAITDAKVTDTLPPYVTVDEESISDGGVFVAGFDSNVSAGTITWSVDLAAAGDEGDGDTVELTYSVTVDEDAPEGAVLVNRAVMFSLEDTTTHVVPTGDLTIVKQVSPVAGTGVVVHFGDTLTYTLNAVASGTLDQPSVVVTDFVPGFDPLRPSSGKTTYVVGSAACVGAGDCTVTEPGADGLITWELGDMAAGTSRQVTFKVTINRPPAQADGAIPAVDILNAGAVESARTPFTPSNEVVTPVTEVLGVKIPNAPLPRTGALVPPAQLAGLAVLLVGLGMLLVGASRRRGRHRRA